MRPETTGREPTGGAYAAAGVSVAEGDRAVELMKAWVDKARRPEVVGGVGGFAGLFDASALQGYDAAAARDERPTASARRSRSRRRSTSTTRSASTWSGMVVDDIVVCGAEAALHDRLHRVRQGRARAHRRRSSRASREACVETGSALLGGETAEHPGLLGPDDYDVAGAATGVVEADRLLGAERVVPGDAVVAMASRGLHSNGFSLVRHVLLAEADGRSTGRSTCSAARWARSCSNRPGSTPSHVSKLAASDRTTRWPTSPAEGWRRTCRVLPAGVSAAVEQVDLGAAADLRAGVEVGSLGRPDLEATLNMGVGMVAVVAPKGADLAVRTLNETGVTAWVCGVVQAVRPRDRRAGGRVRSLSP